MLDLAAKVMGAQMAQEAKTRQEAARLDALEKKIAVLIESNPKLAEFGSQIQLEKTTDGLHIQIVDQQNRPMFDTGSSLVKPYMRDILRAIGGSLGNVENHISLAGHTDATPYGSGDRGYSNWELSADRANASRRELVAGGLPDDKLRRVEGLAASVPLLPDRPLDPSNRRISIVIMTREAEERMLPAASQPSPIEAPAAGPATALQISADLTKPQPQTVR